MTSVISTENPAIVDGASITLTKSGSDNLAVFVGGAKAGSGVTGVTAFSHNNAITVFNDSNSEPVSSLTVAALAGYQLDGDITETAQNLVVTWDFGGGEDFFGTVILLDGVDQTTPLTGFDYQGFDEGLATARSYNASDGDTVIYVYHDTASVSISAPAGWTVAVTPPDTGTTQIDEGITMYKTLTSDENTTVIADNLSGAGSGGQHFVFIVKAVAGGGGVSIPVIMNYYAKQRAS